MNDNVIGGERWYDPLPGQTTARDELRLHLFSEHRHAALGLTDDEAEQLHTAQHMLPGMHGKDRRGWDRARAEDLLGDIAADPASEFFAIEEARVGLARHLERVQVHAGAALPPVIPAPDPAVYDFEDLDESASACLATLRNARAALLTALEEYPRFAAIAVGVIDHQAVDLVDRNRDEDVDG